jgi:hypothetical protein
LKFERRGITHETEEKRKDVLVTFQSTIENDGVRAAAWPVRAWVRAERSSSSVGLEDRE